MLRLPNTIVAVLDDVNGYGVFQTGGINNNNEMCGTSFESSSTGFIARLVDGGSTPGTAGNVSHVWEPPLSR